MHHKTKLFLLVFLLSIGQVLVASSKGEKNLKFIPNEGQWNTNIQYRTNVGGGDLFIEKDGFTFNFTNQEDLHNAHELEHDGNKNASMSHMINHHAYKVNFLNSNQSSQLRSTDELPEVYNYFLGKDQSKWATNLHPTTKIMYSDIYNGVDAAIYSQNGNFKYDFVVSSNSDANQIQLEYKGLDGIQVNESGDLVLLTSLGEFKELKPYAFQMVDGKKREVACMYAIDGEIISFTFPKGYDKNSELIIDPILIGATLSGTNSSGNGNYGHSATYDDNGNIYTGAINRSGGYPTTLGAFQTTYGGSTTDIAISKLDATGSSLIYATYVGGSDNEYPHSLFVHNDELYYLGSTRSTDYPVSASALQVFNGGGSDIILTHLNSTGSALVGSTYLGGSLNDGHNSINVNYGDEFRGEIFVDANGDCGIACYSQSPDFPTTFGAFQTSHGGSQDAVICKLSGDMSTLNWSTYFGGPDADAGYGLRFDANLNVYVTGSVGSGFFIGTGYQSTYQGGLNDGFILKLNANGTSVLNSTYFGANDQEQSFFLDLDPAGDVYIFGQTKQANIPTTSGVYSIPNSTQFISKFDPTLTSLQISTLVGGTGGNTWTSNGLMSPTAFMVDRCGYIYMSGYNTDQSLPLTSDALYTSGSFYLSVLQPNAVGLHFATYYGGIDDHVDGGTSRFDPRGVVYQAVCTDAGFQTTPTAYSSTYPGSSYDIGVFKINFELQTLQADFAVNFTGGNSCAPAAVNFTNNSTGIYYTWNFGDGSPLDTSFQPTHSYVTSGTYNVTLVATDSTACSINDTLVKQIVIGGIGSAVTVTDATCGQSNGAACATGSNGITPYTFAWSNGDLTSCISNLNPGTYYVTVADSSGCSTIDSAIVGNNSAGCCTYEIASNDTVCPGNTTCVWLNAVDSVNNGIIGMNYCISYDTAVMSPTGNATLGQVVYDAIGQGNGEAVQMNTSIPGQVFVTIFYNSSVPSGTFWQGSGQVICVEFNVNVNASSATYNFSACEVEEAYELVEVTNCATPGSVVVAGSASVDAIINYWNFDGINNGPARPLMYDVNNPSDHLITTIDATNGSAVWTHTDLNGGFTWDAQDGNNVLVDRDVAGSYYDTTCTDVFPFINGADAYLAALISNFDINNQLDSNSNWVPNKYQMVAGDVNMNDKVRANDVTQILARSVRIICEYPQVWNYTLGSASNPLPDTTIGVSKDWRFLPADDSSSTVVASDWYVDVNYPVISSSNATGGYWRDDVPTVPNTIELFTPDTTQACPQYDDKMIEAVLLGDLTASWDPSSSFATGVRASGSGVVHFDVYPISGVSNAYTIAVSYEALADRSSIDFRMDYNQNNVTIQNVLGTQEATNANLVSDWNDFGAEKLYVSSYTLSGINTTNTVFNIEVNTTSPITVQDLGSILPMLNGEIVNSDITIHSPTGITDQYSQAGYFNIYPNPSHGLINIEYALAQEGNVQLDISNVLGQVVFAANLGNMSTLTTRTLDLSIFGTGVYHIRLSSEHGEIVKKIILE